MQLGSFATRPWHWWLLIWTQQDWSTRVFSNIFSARERTCLLNAFRNIHESQLIMQILVCKTQSFCCLQNPNHFVSFRVIPVYCIKFPVEKILPSCWHYGRLNGGRTLPNFLSTNRQVDKPFMEDVPSPGEWNRRCISKWFGRDRRRLSLFHSITTNSDCQLVSIVNQYESWSVC